MLVTGRPGVGKTTAVLRAAEELRRMGISVGGMISQEERSGGVRTGFVILDLLTGERAYLARVGEGRPRVGKYVVLVDELERVGVRAILSAMSAAEVVVVDEVGPMELMSNSFREAVTKALDSPKPVVATIHVRASANPFGRAVLSWRDTTLIRVNEWNRGDVPREIVKVVLSSLKQ